MTAILEFREICKKIYSKNEMFILPVIKFIIALIVFSVINGRMGYMDKIDNIAIVLIAALTCSFLPNGCVVFFGALFTLGHMYALSLEVLVVGFCLYFVILLLYMRFAPKDSLVVALMPILFIMKIPYVMPIVMGLVGCSMSAVSVACGVVVYYILSAITVNATAISTMGSDFAGKIRLLLDTFVGNKAMMVTAAVFALTTLVVYVIRRLSIEYSWTIAMVTGAILDLIAMLVGDLVYDIDLSMVSLILGSVLAVGVGKIVEFFRFCVDYGRTERVQYEDDEYYYYVKAVPKMSVAQSTKTVKKINSQREVVTERTSRFYGSNAVDPKPVTGSKSITIGTDYLDDDEEFEEELQDDFEDLF